MAVPEDSVSPRGELATRVVAMSKETNSLGDIYAGWIVAQMDLAGSTCAERRAEGRVATVSIDKMIFLTPVKVGSTISFYNDFLDIGRSSLQSRIEVWASSPGHYEKRKVTEGTLTFVAIDKNGRTRALPQR